MPTSNQILGSFTAVFLLTLAGCSSHPETGKVKGKVSIDGQPMSFGRVQFVPIADGEQMEVGNNAFGYIQTDGTYELSTYGKNDGAVVGRHRVVIVNKSESEQAKAASKGSKLPAFDLIRVPNLRVDVEPGENTIDIPLTSQQLKEFGETD